uniref:CSON005056 protein n=1 Tax=Culicoides sonorensis TaxID=179676 RepID=A0A336MPP3_CULSO
MYNKYITNKNNSNIQLNMPSESINTTSHKSNGSNNNESAANPVRKISYDPTEYVQKARITKAAPPPPAYNPLQFVAVKPVKLYKTSDEPKKAEQIKKEVKKEDAEEWQSNLDNWKCSRRKRVEHIIDRVVEVKKLELEEHDRNRRKSKTFSEMMEERGGRRKISVPIYKDEDGNDLSDLGIITSNTSEKSSISEDLSNQSPMNYTNEQQSVQFNVLQDDMTIKSYNSDDNAVTEWQDVNEQSVKFNVLQDEMMIRSNNSYDASMTEWQGLSEYTYESAIENYKARVKQVSNSSSHLKLLTDNEYDSIEPTTELNMNQKKSQKSDIVQRLQSIELRIDSTDNCEKDKTVNIDLPKVNIAKRRELFEKSQSSQEPIEKRDKCPSTELLQVMSIRERISGLKREEEAQSTFNIDVDIPSVKSRYLILEKNVNIDPEEKQNKIEIPLTGSLKDRLSSLQSCLTSSNNTKAIDNNRNSKEKSPVLNFDSFPKNLNLNDHMSVSSNHKENMEPIDTDREDSGIHTTDISCSVSQVDEQSDEKIFELNSITSVTNSKTDQQSEHVFLTTATEKEEPESITDKAFCKNYAIPDLIQHKNPSTIDNCLSYQDDNVSLSFSEPGAQSSISDDTLLLDVKSLIDNLAITTISDKVEESSIYSNDFEETSFFNTSSMFDETTANDDDSSIFSSSPYRQNNDTSVYNNCKSLTPPSLNLNLSSLKPNAEVSPSSGDHTTKNELVLDYFNKVSETKSETSSPKSPSRSILNFIKTHLIHSSSEQMSPQESSTFYVVEALDIAFQEIDNEVHSNIKQTKQSNTQNDHVVVTDFDELQIETDPLYENIDNILDHKKLCLINNTKILHNNKASPKRPDKISMCNSQEPLEEEVIQYVSESNYQISNTEPYYEVPKTKPVPLYENVQSRGPPTEKPPPPPPMDDMDEEKEVTYTSNKYDENFRRINSTKRIKKEIWNKRSSFLGIENPNDSVFELNVAPPPDMSTFLEEERRFQRQHIMKAGFSDNSDTGESRDSGVSENHSRQSSGPFSVEEQLDTTGKLSPPDKNQSLHLNEDCRLNNIEKQIIEQEEVLRVERELLRLEKKELNRQRINLMHREAKPSQDRENKTSTCGENYVNPLTSYHHQAYQVETEFRKSMPDLQSLIQQKSLALHAPAKPLRAQFKQEYLNANPLLLLKNTNLVENIPKRELNQGNASEVQPIPFQYDFIHSHNKSYRMSHPHSKDDTNIYANMSKQTLHVLSATPKPRLTNEWVQYRSSEPSHSDLYQEINTSHYKNTNKNNYISNNHILDWVQPKKYQHQKRKSEPQSFNYHSHWLIQEAEQRRLDQQRHTSGTNRKSLPDSVIQTITQRVQNMGIGENRRSTHDSNISISNNDLLQTNNQDRNDRILSVSGKKKCTHCGNELGRGAAMIIESLRLFYHIDCFKCFVCHLPLGDGLGGTDVRVRNSKLHCQNCYSSDDGIKFSCV